MGLSAENRGAPKNTNLTTTDPTPHSKLPVHLTNQTKRRKRLPRLAGTRAFLDQLGHTTADKTLCQGGNSYTVGAKRAVVASSAGPGCCWSAPSPPSPGAAAPASVCPSGGAAAGGAAAAAAAAAAVGGAAPAGGAPSPHEEREREYETMLEHGLPVQCTARLSHILFLAILSWKSRNLEHS